MAQEFGQSIARLVYLCCRLPGRMREAGGYGRLKHHLFLCLLVSACHQLVYLCMTCSCGQDFPRYRLVPRVRISKESYTEAFVFFSSRLQSHARSLWLLSLKALWMPNSEGEWRRLHSLVGSGKILVESVGLEIAFYCLSWVVKIPEPEILDMDLV